MSDADNKKNTERLILAPEEIDHKKYKKCFEVKPTDKNSLIIPHFRELALLINEKIHILLSKTR